MKIFVLLDQKTNKYVARNFKKLVNEIWRAKTYVLEKLAYRALLRLKKQSLYDLDLIVKKYEFKEILEVEKVRPTWQNYFFGLAKLISKRSHDVQTQHGCVLVKDNRIIGCGYNGFPRKLDDNVLPNTRPQKYPWMIHSEVNAVSNSIIKPVGATAYVTGTCCNNCLMFMWQNGIENVFEMNSHGSFAADVMDEYVRTKFLELSNMKVEKVDADLTWLRSL